MQMQFFAKKTLVNQEKNLSIYPSVIEFAKIPCLYFFRKRKVTANAVYL